MSHWGLTMVQVHAPPPLQSGASRRGAHKPLGGSSPFFTNIAMPMERWSFAQVGNQDGAILT